MITLPRKRKTLSKEEQKSVADRLEKQLKAEVEAHQITQAQIFEEMTEQEKKLLSGLVGMPYVQATMNRLGIPDGRESESEKG